MEQYDIDNCQIIDDNYNVTIADSEEILVSPLDKALLVDTDFQSRYIEVINEEIGGFSNALISYFGEVKDYKCNTVSIEEVDGQYLFVADTVSDNSKRGIITEEEENQIDDSVRILGDANNIIPYRSIPEEAAKNKYEGSAEYSFVCIVIDGELINIEDVYGIKSVTVNGLEYNIVCGKKQSRDADCIEYLVAKENCILISPLGNEVQSIAGTNLNLEEARTIFNMYVKHTGSYFSDYEVKKAILGVDGFLYVQADLDIGSTDSLIKISAEKYNFEFKDNRKLSTDSTESVDLGKYIFLHYNQESYDWPLFSTGFKLIKIEDKCYYTSESLQITSSTQRDDYEENFDKQGNQLSGIYSVDSVVISTLIKEEELAGYIVAPGEFDVIFDVLGKSFGFTMTNDEYYSECYAYKETSMLGIEYYSIVVKYTTVETGKISYEELLVTKDNAIFKGTEEILGNQKTLKR
jgi:hypothetical protein